MALIKTPAGSVAAGTKTGSITVVRSAVNSTSRPFVPYSSRTGDIISRIMLKIGYIGLGIMGKSIARNIMKAGFPMIVNNRSRASVDELVAEGAKAGASPAEIASQVDVIFTNLPDTPDVEKVVLGDNGIINGAHEGLVFVDNSTIKPAAARSIAVELKKKNVQALDAPVSGGDIGARNGTLTIMVGGEASALNKAMPVFQAMGKTITHVGDAGAGQVAKAANQI